MAMDGLSLHAMLWECRGLSGARVDKVQQPDKDTLLLSCGLIPENDPFAEHAKLNDWGYVDADENCIPESEEGIFVAGDCRSKAVRQIATAISDGAAASVAVCRYLG